MTRTEEPIKIWVVSGEGWNGEFFHCLGAFRHEPDHNDTEKLLLGLKEENTSWQENDSGLYGTPIRQLLVSVLVV